MKIALVTVSSLPSVGGAEFVIHHLACQWSKQGHDVCVINAVTDQATHANGRYTVRRYRMLRGTERYGFHRFPFQWYAVRGLGRQLREWRPDFISAHLGYPTAHWLSLLRPMPRFVTTCHGGDLTPEPWGYRRVYGIDGMLRDALNASAAAIAISAHARQLMLELGVDDSKIVRIPNGVEWDRFQAKADFDLRGRLELPGRALVVLSVGRDHPAKAYETGLRAFAEVARRVPEAYYVMLGRGVSRRESLAAALEIRDRVRLCEGFHGPDLIGAYQQADIFFSSSVQEMFPLVVVEAMAAGLPAVVTNVSGSQDVVETGENGIVVQPGRPEEMAEALCRLLADGALRRRLGEAGREKARSYDWDTVSRRYLELAPGFPPT